MDDATRILDAGTNDYPLDANSTGSAESCPHCSTTIAIGKMFCPSCGYQRDTWASAAQESQTATSQAQRGPALFELRDEQGNSYALPAGETILGRGEVDLQISDGYLSRQHAKFSASPDSLSVMDLGSANGSFVGDIKLEKEVVHELEDAQQITLGKLSLTVARLEPAADATLLAVPAVEDDTAEMEGEPEPAAAGEAVELDAAAEVEVEASGWSLNHPEHGCLSLPTGDLSLGRSASKADAQISGDGYISGLHGIVIAAADSLSYKDLGSTNGSRLNGKALAAYAETSLADGDKLQIGQTEFVVALAAADDSTDEKEISD